MRWMGIRYRQNKALMRDRESEGSRRVSGENRSATGASMPGFKARPPAEPTVLLDDAVVRVTRWDFVSGADTGHHVHGMGYVVVPMTDCKFLIEEPNGSREVDMARGQVYRRDAGVEHNVVNRGEEFMSFIEIEYK
jgi:mannose-6-phosphate isomerase-like protein (cupin superfamily)